MEVECNCVCPNCGEAFTEITEIEPQDMNDLD